MPPVEEYDFVIVGSGSSGSVIANRLSEIADWKILLLEVGEEPSWIVEIPVLAPMLYFTNYNWQYVMEKQPNMSLGNAPQNHLKPLNLSEILLGMTDELMAWPRGRALGGSSIINYMIHVRGNKVDYDEWAAAGNPGWSYDDVLPYFKKSEDFKVRIKDKGYHRRGGYLSVEDVPHRSKSSTAFVDALQELGYKYVDYNGKDQMGVSYAHGTLINGKRCSAEAAFLRPIRHRRNLRILTKARATKVLIDPSTKKAYGVEYLRNRKYHKALVKKEVILSAGAFNSPQLLMLSGVGPKEHLEEIGVNVLRDLPVGKKMYDHLTFFGLTFTVNQSIVHVQNDLYLPQTALEFITNGSGLYTSIGGVEALAYIRTKLSQHPVPNYPDVELIFAAAHFSTDKGQFYRKSFRVSDELYDTVWKPLEDSHVFVIAPMLFHPKSYGYLKLKSKNPFHWPKFYGNFLTDPDNIDKRTFIEAIRMIQRIVLRTNSFKKYGARMVRTPFPGCKHVPFDTDQYWECALQYVTTTLHHQVATCKMGPSNDPEAVVNNKLKVYGIKNLRVADTSIIPIPLSAHTNVPAFMVGEKASDLIKEDWLNEHQHVSPRSVNF